MLDMTASPESHSKPVFQYLRVSVTDRCNLRCVYCMPPQGVPKLAHESILRYEEILSIIRVAISEGVRRVRITGGEPLVRKGIASFISEVAKLEGLTDLSMTTNGILLSRFAGPLRAAGLKRVNVSLDSLDAARYREITRGGELQAVLDGLHSALKAGLDPVKVNVVIIPGENEDQIERFTNLARTMPVHVRFIERMPFQTTGQAAPFLPEEELRRRIGLLAELLPEAEETEGGGPSRTFRIRGGSGRIGFISPRTHPFCPTCNRLRLTASGILRPCLDSNVGIDVSGFDPDHVRNAIQELGRGKREAGKSCAGFANVGCISLSDIGG